MVSLVAQTLEALKPAARGRIASRAAAMEAVLQRLDRWNRHQFATITRPSPLATGHHAFASLARAYGLQELPVMESLGSSQSLRPQAFASVLAALKRERVTMLFAETLPASKPCNGSVPSAACRSQPPLVADGLAKDTSPRPPGSSSLVGTLTANTCLIVEGLRGRCDQAGRRHLMELWSAIP
jgi:zinc/manganese transport system substrate-binding protein